MIWDSLKAGLRGKTLTYGWAKQKRQKKHMQALLAGLRKAECELIQAVRVNADTKEVQTKKPGRPGLMGYGVKK